MNEGGSLADKPEALRIQLCGQLAIVKGDRRLEAGLPGSLGRALFAYLVVNRDRSLSRDELCAALWGDAVPAGDPLSPLVSRCARSWGKNRSTDAAR